jgi:hypothetical protein
MSRNEEKTNRIHSRATASVHEKVMPYLTLGVGIPFLVVDYLLWQ